MRTVLPMLVLGVLAGLAGPAGPAEPAPPVRAAIGGDLAAAPGPLVLHAAAPGPPALHAASPGSLVLPAAGSLVLPVAPPPVVLTPFRAPEHRYGRGHRGVDLAAPAGSPVRAAASGSVVFAGMLAGRGVVSIELAGGVRTTYEPIRPSVATGQRVAAGAAIGTLAPGHPSCAPADCLHWGVRMPDGTYLDPMALLRPWRVRLKPWDRS